MARLYQRITSRRGARAARRGSTPTAPRPRAARHLERRHLVVGEHVVAPGAKHRHHGVDAVLDPRDGDEQRSRGADPIEMLAQRPRRLTRVLRRVAILPVRAPWLAGEQRQERAQVLHLLVAAHQRAHVGHTAEVHVEAPGLPHERRHRERAVVPHARVQPREHEARELTAPQRARRAVERIDGRSQTLSDLSIPDSISRRPRRWRAWRRRS
jgi:hypothetical protein